MKQIKKMNLKTKEGFSLRNIITFPSLEWGDNGGIKADLLYCGAYIGNLYNAGDGGMANFYFDDGVNIDLIKNEVLKCLKRLDTCYTLYKFLRERTPKQVNEDDYDALVALLVDNYARGKRGVI